MTRFELATFWTQTRRSTKLSYTLGLTCFYSNRLTFATLSDLTRSNDMVGLQVVNTQSWYSGFWFKGYFNPAGYSAF